MASIDQGYSDDAVDPIEIADVLDDRAVAIEEHGAGLVLRHVIRLAGMPSHRGDGNAPHAPVIERTLAQHARAAPDRVRERPRAPPRSAARSGARRSARTAPSIGTPSAAPRCIAPESFDTSAARMRQHAGERRQSCGRRDR